MYIQVRLLNGFARKLTYKLPESWQKDTLPGSFVRVPLRNRQQVALIEEMVPAIQAAHYEIKYALAIEATPQDPLFAAFIKKLAYYYQIDYIQLIKRIRDFIYQQEAPQEFMLSEQNVASPSKLTSAQQSVVDTIKPAIAQKTYKATVLHGVTGSGKTEVYKHLIQEAFLVQKTTVLLLPEVTLALQFERLLKTQLDIPIFGFHSACSKASKLALWRHLINKKPILIIGVHLPMMLPITNLGLIIVDEEHEVGYQEKKHPKINSKEAAIWRAQQYNIPIVLGSATPSISSLYNVEHKRWKLLKLEERFCGKFPTISCVNLNDKKKRKSFWISTQLHAAIAQQLLKKEQTIIFLNRRGYSFFIMCLACNFVFSCPNCSVSLTFHQNNTLTCHYCSYSIPLPTTCSACKAPEKSLLKKGIGTQQVVAILEKLFPAARIARADLDSTINKKKWQATMTDFQQKKLDILVGTQTITKGYHFPGVTLVGVLWADLNLHFPIYNAAETTLQQLIQVSGRAGRTSDHSRVIIQTIDTHPIFSYINEQHYLDFYAYELQKRALVCYPPLTRLAYIELKHDNEERIEQEAHYATTLLHQSTEKNGFTIRILGPSKPAVHKVKNAHSRQIYLKGSSIQDMIKLYQALNQHQFESRLFFTPNPLN